jgi:hypothetical protein
MNYLNRGKSGPKLLAMFAIKASCPKNCENWPNLVTLRTIEEKIKNELNRKSRFKWLQSRVARFFLARHTKTVKIHQNGHKNTKFP